ncbi:MAG TPA: hypothetical protein VIM16_20120 [Mucilaginibacter sp.]|jgi:hypothetical protein
MIEKTLKTTTGKLMVKTPTNLNEITLGQMMELQEKPSLTDMEAISILAGIPVGQLQNVCKIDDLMAFGDAVCALSEQIIRLYDSDAIPQKVTFRRHDGDVTIAVIKNLSVEPAGAFMAAREIIAGEINEHIADYGEDDLMESFNPSLKACCQVLAHYFYCRVTARQYDEYEAEEFCNEVKKLRVTEALPIAKHFFTCYPNLYKPKISFWHRVLRF